MVPHKSPRGGEALSRLRCYEGCPAPYDKVKRMVVPAAYRVSNLRYFICFYIVYKIDLIVLTSLSVILPTSSAGSIRLL
jgi:large subunit ribosomal protein L13Ae